MKDEAKRIRQQEESLKADERDFKQKKSSRGKGKRRPKPTQNVQRKSRRDYDADSDLQEVGRSTRNAFKWYNKYPEYTKYAGTIPTGRPIGEKLDLQEPGDGSPINGLQQVIPGIMTITFTPTIGYSGDRNSPINRSAIRWYSMLRKAQKASSNYDSQDMMMTYMAVDSLAMFHELGKRIVGIANLDSVLNRYVPEGLLTAMNVDPLDVRNRLADWWGYVNKFAIDAENVTMPKDMDLRERHSWMCSGLYTDGTTERSQIYMFVPSGFWKYNNTVTTGSQLEFVEWRQPTATNNKLITLEEYQAIGNSLLSAVFGDEDTGYICGDTYNAIGASNCIGFDQIAINYKITALYSEMVLSQIENCTTVGNFAPSWTPVITQNPSVNQGAILFQPQFSYVNTSPNNVATRKSLLLNFHHADPSVEEVIEATRLRTMVTGKASSNIITPTSFGSEIVNWFRIWTSQAAVGKPQEFDFGGLVFGTNFILLTSGTLDTVSLTKLAQLSAFDWHPIVYLMTSTSATISETDQVTLLSALVDYDVTTILPYDKLADMHEAALMSEFAIPETLFKSLASRSK